MCRTTIGGDRITPGPFKLASQKDLIGRYAGSGGWWRGVRTSASSDRHPSRLSFGRVGGGGYHGDTNLAHQRAPASTAQTVVQEVRFKKNMDRIETFLDTYKHQARTTVRYEWRNWKRVLQSSKKKLHRNKQMQDTAAMKRVYRMDAMARDNWDIAFRRGAKEDALPIEDDEVDAVQREYLAALFCVHHVFVCP